MQRRFGGRLLAFIAAALIAATVAFAQQEARQPLFTAWLEGLLSTPDRQIAIKGLEGVFSANPTVESITVSDRNGPWLELDGVSVAWHRAALLDRTLSIESLRARQVRFLRKPAASEASDTSGGGFSGLPIAVKVDAIALPRIMLAAPVAGGEAELAAAGSAQLTEEALAAQLSVYRQDRAGTLTAELRLEPRANVLTADLTLDEPQGGLVAELIGLPDRPAINARISGTGPLDNWSAKLAASAGGAKVLDGSMAVARVDAGYRVVADMNAALESVAPADYASLVAGDSKLTLDLSRFDDGAISLATASMHSAGLALAASGETTPDLVPERAALSLRLGQAGRATLPFAPGNASVAGLQVDAELEKGASAPWRIGVAADGVESAFGTLAKLTLNANGEAANLAHPSARATSFAVAGTLSGMKPSDARLRDAVGDEVTLNAEGSWSAGDPVTVSDLRAVIDGAAASFAGSVTAEMLDGTFGVTLSDLSRFSGLAGRVLAGSAQLQAKGSARKDASFDLKLDGQTANLKLGIAALDPLTAGTTTLSGGVARDDKGGLSFDELALGNERMTAEVNGSAAAPDLDLSVSADVADLSLATERAAGAAHISAKLTGASDAPRVEADLSGDNVVLMGQPLTDASARFSGVVAGPDTAGEAELSGRLGDTPLEGSAKLSAGENGARVLQGLRFAVGESHASGDLTIGADGLLSGKLAVVSPDLSRIAPLFLVDASGMLSADISLAAENGMQSASITGTAADIAYENVRLETADIKGRGSDLFGAPQLEGDFSLRNLTTGGLSIVTATGTATRHGDATAVKAEAQLADGRAALAANLAPREGGLAIGLQSFSFKRNGLDLALSSPTEIVVGSGGARFDGATFQAGGGSATISGSAGEALDVTLALNALPAALANSFSPELGAAGAISGNVKVSGTPSAPVADFDIQMANASLAASRDAGVGPLGIATQGKFADNKVKLTSRISGRDGLAVNVSGETGVAESAPLDFAVVGAVPLSLGNQQLAARGAALSGTVDVNIKVAGTRTAPKFSGRITSEGGGFIDPQSGIVLSNLSLSAGLSGDRLVIERLNAKSGDGTVAATGTLGLDPKAGMPADMKITVKNARYVDGTLIAATFSADLTVGGRLTETPKLAGIVRIARAEITVPEKLPGGGVAVDVKHVAPPPPVEQTLEAIRERESRASGGGGGGGGGGPGGIILDVKVNAPRAIFVRGRGLDTEFGGSMRLVGSVSNIVTSGSFEIVRGRLDILTQRISLDRGIITFAGDLDPILDFVGTTQSGGVTITVTISGRASDPEITFSSSPDLPQDEILARLIFQKGINELSPVQIARLGAAAAELTGGGGGGILGQLRATTGLDDLDIVVDEQGQASLAAGRYISDNIYVGVQQGTSADSSKVTIDLDITKDIKARAGYSVQGESSLGIFFEKEY